MVKSSRHSSRRGAAVLAAVVLALCAAALAGALTLAPVAAAAPDAAQIDAFLTEHASPMTGSGATFIAEGEAHGVNPVFLVAISGAETSFGQHLYSENGDECTYNAFNWFFGPTWPQSDFASWDEAIARVAEGLSGDLYYGMGLYAVEAIAPKYCPDGTSNWIANVDAFMIALGGDPADTRVSAIGATPTPTPTPTPAPTSTSPALVALDGSVELDRGDREVGQRIFAWFTLTNTGAQPVELAGIRLAIRGPGDTGRDLISEQPLTLQAGQSTEVSAIWPLDLAGRWQGWIEVTQNGEATLAGDEQAFAFWVKLPKYLEERRWVLHDADVTGSL